MLHKRVASSQDLSLALFKCPSLSGDVLVCSTPQGRRGYDLLDSTQQMAEKIKTKWTNPEVSANCCNAERLNQSYGAAIIFRKLLLEHGAQLLFCNEFKPSQIESNDSFSVAVKE